MSLEVRDLGLSGPRLITPSKFGDARGFFSETYNRRVFAEAGIDLEFVQDNHVSSREPGTVRGLHFQAPPSSQAKLVRVVRGAVFDVIVDLRIGSPHFGRHAAVQLSADNWRQLFVPTGFAHGYCTLVADTEMLYKTDRFYEPQSEGGVLWNDPDLAIDWPEIAGSQISDKDRQLTHFRDLHSPFKFTARVD